MNALLFSVEHKTVVITGGLGRLGRCFAKAFVERHARVAIIDKPDHPNRKEFNLTFQAAIKDDCLLIVEADVTDRTRLNAAQETIGNALGSVDVLINAAALDSPPDAPAAENGPFETYPEESWDEIMAVNTKGVFLCCQVFGGEMAETGGGSVINIGSIYGLVSPDQSLYEYRRERGETYFKPVAYSASKSALLNLTRYLATYWASSGVRVNLLTFGGVWDDQDEAFLEGYRRRVPLGRMATPEDYVGAVLFLASDASSYMTGANMVVDGGWTAW